MKKYLNIILAGINLVAIFALYALSFAKTTIESSNCYEAMTELYGIESLVAFKALSIIAMVLVCLSLVCAVAELFVSKKILSVVFVLLSIVTAVFMIGAMSCNISFVLNDLAGAATIGIGVILATVVTIIISVAVCYLNRKLFAQDKKSTK